MKRFVWPGALLVLLASASVSAQEFQRYHFKKPVELRLDATRLAVRQMTNAVQGYREKAGAFQYPLPEWRLVDCEDENADAGSVRTAVSATAARGQAGFVSPVFIDDMGGPLVITQDILVGVKDSIPAAKARAIVARYGAVIEEGVGGLPNGYKVRSHSRSGVEVLEQANELARMDEVDFAEPDIIATGREGLLPNDPRFQYSWGLHNTGQFAGGVAGVDMGAVEAWDTTTGSSTVITVVLDSGVESSHPDLSGRVLTPGFDATGAGGAGGPVSVCDDHGTAVAGCIVGKINNGIGGVGIAPNTRVASARAYVMNPSCNGSFTFQTSWIANTLAWAQSIGARVTNNSNAYGGTASVIDAAYQSTYDAGIIHFASAANDGTGTVSYPASIPVVNSVASIDHDGNRSSFSNWGNGLDFSAPGSFISTTDRSGANGYSSSDYVFVDGTSFASPYAAGVAALILSKSPWLMPAQVEAIMRATARDLGTNGYDTDFGYGLVRADAAMLAVNGDCGLTWEQDFGSHRPSARAAPTLAFDSARNVTILKGGTIPPAGAANDTWEWNGSFWRLRFETAGPTEKNGASMAFDSQRNRAVFFGGTQPYTNNSSSETWEWDGTTWSFRTSSGPAGRDSACLAYDSARGRTVLFGGSNVPSFSLNDTWEWDGSTWQLRSTDGPPRRYGAMMAYDSARQVTVLYGGRTVFPVNGAQFLGDTWEWNGSAWTQIQIPGPPARVGGVLVYDAARSRMVLFGGYYPNSNLAEHWEYDGVQWIQRMIATPAARDSVAGAFDSARGRVVLFAGADGSGMFGDAWEFDGERWIPVSGPGPSARLGAGMAYSAELGGAVMFGGLTEFAQPYSHVTDQLWLRTPKAWGRLNGSGPPARVYPMLGSTWNGSLFMFGGLAGSDVGKNDLWRFSGGQWLQANTSNPPAARWGGVSCMFTASNTFVVFGGQFNGTLVPNTLSLVDVGTLETWQHYPGGGGPSARDGAMMAYDPVRDEAILFGGRGAGGWDLDDVWRLRIVAGVPQWTQMSSLGIIRGWSGGSMFWDPGRQRILLYAKEQHGFEPGGGVVPAVYEWTGVEFVKIAESQEPALRRYAVMAPTSQDGDIRMFGGLLASDGSTILSDTWAFNGVATPGFPRGATGGGSFASGSTVTLRLPLVVGQSPALRWKRDGDPVYDGTTPSGTVITGAQTDTLVLSNIRPAEAGTYVCSATNPCGSDESNPVVVEVFTICPADLNGDLMVDDSDFVIFASAYDILDCNDPNMPIGCPADINGDGMVEDLDFVLFASAYDQLICP